MSGIAGIIHFDGKPVEPGQVEAMTAAMPYRGPDGINHWRRGNVALGQCMLRTTPESLEETQPLTNEDESLVLVMDGRVDNWEELRRELLGKGTVLRTRADAELVLRAYEVWGRDCLSHMEGDFALVIWDARLQEAFCARDRMGNKPFHYHWNGKTLAFSSEVHPILDLPWVPQQFNEGMVAEFLGTEWLSRNETFWKGVMRLVAACRMTVNSIGPILDEYWTPDLWVKLPYSTDEEYVEHYRELFADVVRRMSRSSDTVACEVSGGLDSSAIFAVAESMRRRQHFPAPGLEGYVLDFQGNPDADERNYAQAVGAHHGRLIHEIPPTRKPLAWYRETAAFHKDFPGYPNGIMGLGIREQARLSGSRVLLTGNGGDEWVGGLRTYYAETLAAGQWQQFYDCLKVDVKEVGLRRSLGWMVRHNLAPALPTKVKDGLRKLLRGRLLNSIDRETWLAPPLKRMLVERRQQYPRPRLGSYLRLGQVSQFSMLSGPYSALARESEERLSSGVGIELRSPFLDPRMVQFAFSTPDSLRIRGAVDKVMHRKAMKEQLPDIVLKRNTKADFMIAFQWHWPELADALIQAPGSSSEQCDWVSKVEVAKLYEQGMTPIHSGLTEWMLWTLFACESIPEKRKQV
ncbi:MAG: asparagine synthase (glutamine-hydrolyzing) [Polaromonas sp.]|nr:asparagine synthase (glutamine-hydrolyzing) [Polaromonas sp.]